ncbi:degenerate transposase [Streptococcus pneumoniae]|nr:degenerate transposase [Streptococcus pneumoniae]
MEQLHFITKLLDIKDPNVQILTISTSTVIRKLNDFHFKHDFSCLPEIMSWDVETVRGVTVSIVRWR